MQIRRFGRAVACAAVAMGTLTLGACVHSQAERAVLAQNRDNTAALSANIQSLAAAARESSRVECELIVRRTRERVSDALVRLRATIAPDAPTESELLAPESSWRRSLQSDVEALASRIAVGPVDARASIVRALADDHPATIDIAAGTPGFSVARVLRDAVELDHLNQLIDAEPSAAVRSALLGKRDDLLAAYLPVRLTIEATSTYRSALDSYLATVQKQADIAGLHAQALSASASAPDAQSAAGALLGNQDIWGVVLEIVSRQWGASVAADVADRLERARRALDLPTH